MTAHIESWLKSHDDRWSFILFYVGGAVILSIYASLFWVAMLMCAHYVIEVWRHTVIKSRAPFLVAFWHIKLDIALLLFALVIALYAELAIAALGIGQAARVGGHMARSVQVATRFAIIERGLRIFFLTIDDIARIALICWKTLKGRNSTTDAEMADARQKIQTEEEELYPDSPDNHLSGGDVFSLSFGGLCLLLIISAPWFTGTGIDGVIATIARELSPHASL